MKELLDKTEERLKKAIASTQREFASIRTGRASASLLDRITVDYYGTETPIKTLANVSVPDARSLQIQIFDKGAVKLVEKAILKSDLGLTPNSDGTSIRLNIPPLTEERRKELVKVAKKSSEEGKVALRNIRRDELENLKKQEKEGVLSEDDRKRGEESIQKLVDRYSKELDTMLGAKEKEILEI
jgi:ribosome recycling factor